MNLPGRRLSVPSLTAKDRRDLELGCAEGVDLVALSFVRHESDLDPVWEILDKGDGPRALVIAKIEKPEAIEACGAIADVADGLMVARGDLGVEIPIERIAVE